MTSKEKAEELISKYISNQNSWYLENLVDGLKIAQAKKCALIAVDEILDLIITIYDYDGEVLEPYWKQVKKELEKL
jgi:hypothetical protein